jgi:hypothetical protein
METSSARHCAERYSITPEHPSIVTIGVVPVTCQNLTTPHKKGQSLVTPTIAMISEAYRINFAAGASGYCNDRNRGRNETTNKSGGDLNLA